MQDRLIAPTRIFHSRRPRFRRLNPPPLRLTTDDLSVIRHVGEHRFLRSTHLVQLLPRSPEKLIRRLGALYHNGYLDRPRAQIDAYVRGGSAPLVYALGNRGAAHYAQCMMIDPVRVDWTDKNRAAGRPYIEHALLVADLMIGLELAVRNNPALRLVSARDIVAGLPEPLHRRFGGWTLTATLPYSAIEIAVTPDKVFALDYIDRGRRNYFAVEADRATMPIERRSLAQSSFKKKLLTYWLAHQAGQHTAKWNMPGLRVLTITSSAERIASMIAAAKEITDGKGSNVFLFADRGMLADGNPLAIHWISGKGQRVRLIEA